MAVSMWRIKPQIVKVKGDEVEVDVKQIKFFPKTCPTTNQVIGFGMLDPGIWPWQVLVQRYNWGPDDHFRIQWNPTSGKYRIVYREWDDKVDPSSRHWKGPGHVIRRVEEDKSMSLRAFMDKMAERIKDPVFEGLILGTLHSGAAQAAA